MTECCYIHSVEDVMAAQSICRLLMASDPSPVDEATDGMVINTVTEMAAQYGFTSWIELFHADLSRPDEATHESVARLSCKLPAVFSIVSNGYEQDETFACENHAGVLTGPLDNPLGAPGTAWTLTRMEG